MTRISVDVFTRAGGQNVRCFRGKMLRGLRNSITRMLRRDLRNMFYLRPFNRVLCRFSAGCPGVGTSPGLWFSAFGATCAWQANIAWILGRILLFWKIGSLMSSDLLTRYQYCVSLNSINTPNYYVAKLLQGFNTRNMKQLKRSCISLCTINRN